jgi:hypothetical protein
MLNIEGLRASLPDLNDSERNFANSLLKSYGRYGSLTSRQEPWIDRLIEKAKRNLEPKKPAEQVGDLSAINAMFDRAKKHLRHPAIVIQLPAVGELRINVAGNNARVPGSINVATNAPYGMNTWYGRIRQDGSFEPSQRAAAPDALLPGLRAFAEDPAKMAAEHGRLTGRCCFCDRKLTDERSTAVGYGSTCARNYGLPWGARPVDQFGADEAMMQKLEAQGDREQTIREERAKFDARSAMENGYAETAWGEPI